MSDRLGLDEQDLARTYEKDEDRSSKKLGHGERAPKLPAGQLGDKASPVFLCTLKGRAQEPWLKGLERTCLTGKGDLTIRALDGKPSTTDEARH